MYKKDGEQGQGGQTNQQAKKKMTMLSMLR